MSGIVTPSYHGGFYSPRRGGRPKFQQLWRDRLFSTAPLLGSTGNTLRDDMGIVEFTRTGTPQPQIKEGIHAHFFDGNNDHYGSATNTTVQVSVDFSVSAWLYAQTPTSSALGGVADKYDATAGFELMVNSTGTITMDVRNSGGYQNTGDSTTDIRDAWHHVVGVKRGTDFGLWVDGIREVTFTLSAGTSCATTGSPLYVGRLSGGTPHSFKGWIAELAIVNHAFTPNEIATLSRRPGIAYELQRRRSDAVPAAGGVTRRRMMLSAI